MVWAIPSTVSKTVQQKLQKWPFLRIQISLEGLIPENCCVKFGTKKIKSLRVQTDGENSTLLRSAVLTLLA